MPTIQQRKIAKHVNFQGRNACNVFAEHLVSCLLFSLLRLLFWVCLFGLSPLLADSVP